MRLAWAWSRWLGGRAAAGIGGPSGAAGGASSAGSGSAGGISSGLGCCLLIGAAGDCSRRCCASLREGDPWPLCSSRDGASCRCERYCLFLLRIAGCLL